jgi:hypothetical protein
MPDTCASRIAVQRIDLPGRLFVLPIDQVAYVFLGCAVNHGLIDPVWASDRVLDSATVYVRTVKGQLFDTGSATLRELRQTLDPARFFSTHRLVIVNVDRLVELDLGGRVTRVGVFVGGSVEFLPISRRRVRALRALVVFPKRVPRRHVPRDTPPCGPPAAESRPLTGGSVDPSGATVLNHSRRERKEARP